MNQSEPDQTQPKPDPLADGTPCILHLVEKLFGMVINPLPIKSDDSKFVHHAPAHDPSLLVLCLLSIHGLSSSNAVYLGPAMATSAEHPFLGMIVCNERTDRGTNYERSVTAESRDYGHRVIVQ